MPAETAPRPAMPLYVSPAIKTITDTDAETSAIYDGAISLPPLSVGKEIEIRSNGVYWTPLLGADVTVRVKLGGTTIASRVTTALINDASRKPFRLALDLTVQSVGESGQIRFGGEIGYSTLGGRVFDEFDESADLATVNTSTETSLDVTVEWDSASASRSIQVNTFRVLLLG